MLQLTPLLQGSGVEKFIVIILFLLQAAVFDAWGETNLISSRFATRSVGKVAGDELLLDKRQRKVFSLPVGQDLTFVFAKPHHISMLRMLFPPNLSKDIEYGFVVEGSVDGENWEVIAEQQATRPRRWLKLSIDAAEISYIRLIPTLETSEETIKLMRFEVITEDEEVALKRNLALYLLKGSVLLNGVANRNLNDGKDSFELVGSESTMEVAFIDGREFALRGVILRSKENINEKFEIAIQATANGVTNDLGMQWVSFISGQALVTFPAVPASRLVVTLKDIRELRLSEVEVYEDPSVESLVDKLVWQRLLEPPALQMSENIGSFLQGTRIGDSSIGKIEDIQGLLFSGNSRPVVCSTSQARSPSIMFRFFRDELVALDEVWMRLQSKAQRVTISIGDKDGRKVQVSNSFLPETTTIPAEWVKIRLPDDALGQAVEIGFSDSTALKLFEIRLLEDSDRPGYIPLHARLARRLEVEPSSLNLLSPVFGSRWLESSCVAKWPEANLVDSLISYSRGPMPKSPGWWAVSCASESPMDLTFRIGSGKVPRELDAVEINPTAYHGSVYITDEDVQKSLMDTPYEFGVSLSDDGKLWREIPQKFYLHPMAAAQIFDLPEGSKASHIRFSFFSNYGGKGFKLGEVQVFGEPIREEVDLAALELGGAVLYSSARAANAKEDLGVVLEGEGEYVFPYKQLPAKLILGFNSLSEAEVKAIEVVGTKKSNIERVDIAFSEPPFLDEPLLSSVSYKWPVGSQLLHIELEQPVVARSVAIILYPRNVASIKLSQVKIIGKFGSYIPTDLPSSDSQTELGQRQETELNDSQELANGLEVSELVSGCLSSSSDVDTFVFSGSADLLLEPSVRSSSPILLELVQGDRKVSLRPHGAGRYHYGSFRTSELPTYLSLKNAPLRVVLLIDDSSSMAGSRDMVEKAASSFVEQLREGDKLALFSFSDRPQMLSGFSDDANKLRSILSSSLETSGATSLYDALVESGRYLSSSEEFAHKAIILLSDGADSASTASDQRKVWQHLSGGEIALYSIALGADAQAYVPELAGSAGINLAALSQISGGAYFRAYTAAMLHSAYQEILKKLRLDPAYSLSLKKSDQLGRLRLVSSVNMQSVSQSVKVGIIIDSSGSMMKAITGKQSRLSVARKVLEDILLKLPPNVPVLVRAYGHRYPKEPKKRSCEDTELISARDGLDRKVLVQRVRQLKARGQTPLGKALALMGRDMKVGESSTKALIVALTDGEESCAQDAGSPDAPENVIRELRSQGVEVSINIVGFGIGRGGAENRLTELAKLGGGGYFPATTAGELTSAMEGALALRYEIQDVFSRVIAVGRLDGKEIELPAGTYTAVLENGLTKSLVVKEGDITEVVMSTGW